MTRREEEIMVLTCVMLARWLWGYATAAWIELAIGLPPRRIRVLLKSLEEQGEVERAGRGAFGATIWRRRSPQ